MIVLGSRYSLSDGSVHQLLHRHCGIAEIEPLRKGHGPQLKEQLAQRLIRDLLDVLWESLEAEVPALTDEQRAELDYRVAGYEENPSDVIPWEDVRANLFKKP